MSTGISLERRELPSGETPVTALRLAEGPAGPALVISRGGGTALDQLSLETEAKARALLRLQGRLGASAWDLVLDETGAPASVSNVPQSADCPLSFEDAEGASPVSERYPRGVFLGPRFVKGYGGGRIPLTAISDSSSDPHVALFVPETRGGYGEAQRLYAAPRGGTVEAALVLRAPGRHLLCCKSYQPDCAPFDEEGLLPQRQDASGEFLRPGELSYQWLDGQCRPTGPEVVIPGAQGVFEFDAMLLGDHLVLAATNLQGSFIASGIPNDSGFAGANWQGSHPDVELCSPAVAREGAGVLLAALELSKGTARGLVLARITLAA